MTTDDKKTVEPSSPQREKKNLGPPAQAGSDLCRCKETALMTPRQLLQRVFDDLSFWKRPKQG